MAVKMTKTDPRPHSLVSLDYLRVISAFGVVWFHMRIEWDRNIGYAGLFAFAMVASFLAWRSASHRDFLGFARGRFERLIVPWIFWSIFYVLLRTSLSGRITIRPIGEVLNLGMILGGGHIVLWYLSFMFLVSIAIFAIESVTAKVSRFSLSLFFSLTSLFIVSVMPVIGAESLSYPFAQWLAILPAVLWGLSVGSALDIPSKQTQLLSFLFISLVVTGSTVYRFWSTLDLGAVSLCLGVLLSISCILVQLPHSPIVKWLSGLTLGVYVLHPCVSKLIEISTFHVPFPLDVTVVFGLSILCAAALSRVSVLRRVV